MLRIYPGGLFVTSFPGSLDTKIGDVDTRCSVTHGDLKAPRGPPVSPLTRSNKRGMIDILKSIGGY